MTLNVYELINRNFALARLCAEDVELWEAEFGDIVEWNTWFRVYEYYKERHTIYLPIRDKHDYHNETKIVRRRK